MRDVLVREEWSPKIKEAAAQPEVLVAAVEVVAPGTNQFLTL